MIELLIGRKRMIKRAILLVSMVSILCMVLMSTRLTSTGRSNQVSNIRNTYIADVSSLQDTDLSSLKDTDLRSPQDTELTSDVSEILKSLVGNDTLYPEEYDISRVMQFFRTAKIVHAERLRKGTSLKWLLELEGGIKAIFKPRIVPKSHLFKNCTRSCEHPEYEVAAFAIHRMLNLRNVPYTTGRILSWEQELLPVAEGDLFPRLIQDGKTICVRCMCYRDSTPAKMCYEGGNIPGALIYFLPQKIKYFHKHPFGSQFKPNITNSKWRDVCEDLQKTSPYTDDNLFVDTTDFAVVDYLMGHSDRQHFYIADDNDGHPVMNVALDNGFAFCPLYERYTRVIFPLKYCCKIRKRVYEALLKHNDDFTTVFDNLTKDDPLYPLLDGTFLSVFQARIDHLLNLVHSCLLKNNMTNVVIDV